MKMVVDDSLTYVVPFLRPSQRKILRASRSRRPVLKEKGFIKGGPQTFSAKGVRGQQIRKKIWSKTLGAFIDIKK